MTAILLLVKKIMKVHSLVWNSPQFLWFSFGFAAGYAYQFVLPLVCK